MVDDGEGAMAETPTDEPKLYRELPRGKRMIRAAGIAFTIYHVGAVLAGGAIPPVKKALSPIFGFYADGLRMTNSWGMFGRPPNTTNVTIEVDTKEGRGVLVSTTRAKDRTFTERVRDVRVRKIQGKLSEDGDRGRFGQQYLDYFCRFPPPGHTEVRVVRAINHLHELRDDDGKVTREATTRVLFTRRCPGVGLGGRMTLPRPPVTATPPPSQPGGGDL